MNGTTDLARFDNQWYQPGPAWKRAAWYVISACFFQSGFPFVSWKRFLLRAFGARIGQGVVIKPRVTIKYPWKLSIGDHAWIGEQVWIDNLGEVVIGEHCCISQGAMLLCGNHDHSKSTFDLMVGAITLEAGAWIGAKSIVGPGVTVHTHAVLSLGSVASRDLDAYMIYRGNPAEKVKDRTIIP